MTACGASATPEPVPQTREHPVVAAASLTDAFTEIGAAFDAVNPGVTTTFNFAGSQTLRTQIEEGAPADVFASASGKENGNACNRCLRWRRWFASISIQ
ncbi:MAG: molybdate ABC transporter substrate-binding protein [Anaerolineales bacterium]|nr:molybdate ABC transporter substrate-binding protein [Anaerolineales bacterium]